MDKKESAILPPGVLKSPEVGGHSVDMVRNQRSALRCGQGQDFSIFLTAQSSGVSCQKVDGWFMAKKAVHNGFVKIGIRQKANLHGRAV